MEQKNKLNSSYIDYAINQLQKLTAIPSPTGFTKQASAYLIELLKSLGYSPIVSKKGAVLCKLGGVENGLLLSAHVDTLGLMVRSLKANGRLRFTKIGGFPETSIETENCTVHTRTDKTYSGTVKMLEPAAHVNRDLGKLERNDETMEIVLDEKAVSKEDLEKLEISAGDFISLDPRTKVTNSGYIKSRHLDDKASAAILLTLAKYLKENKVELKRAVYLLFTTYEEVGHGASSFVPKDVVDFVSVDMGAVGDDLTTDECKVSICAKDSGGPYDYDLTSELINVAKNLSLNYAVDIYPHYGSDAEAALRAGFDIRHGLIGPGVSASHGYERTHKEGIENTLKLLLGYLLNT
ncbi:MAG: M42 family metallopeptidase [Firmicutes bacterium]|nr:M42 family metallopeptidase [Bacillota bacterium]